MKETNVDKIGSAAVDSIYYTLMEVYFIEPTTNTNINKVDSNCNYYSLALKICSIKDNKEAVLIVKILKITMSFLIKRFGWETQEP